MSVPVNSVINGDCLEVMKDIESASIDMILCDLPYGATQNSWDTVIPPPPHYGNSMSVLLNRMERSCFLGKINLLPQ